MTSIRTTKRGIDIVLSVVLALPAAAFTVAGMLFVFVETRRAPLFRQTRVGLAQQPFQLLKLRTMNVEAPSAPTHLVGDHHVTRSGAILRRLKIDELPQVWSVLRGDMSFVGPRPCLLNQTELIEARAAAGIFDLTPGITGLAQVRGIDMSDPARLVAVESEYAETACLALDMRLLLKTVFGAGQGDNVESLR